MQLDEDGMIRVSRASEPSVTWWKIRVRNVWAHLYRSAEQEEGQVEEREAWYQVLILRHGPPMVPVLNVHHHHVDHETHDGEAKNQADYERILPPDGEKETVRDHVSLAAWLR